MTSRRTPICFLLPLLLAEVFACPRGDALELAFTASIAGQPQAVRADLVYLQQVAYVSLGDLAEGLGGGCRIRPTQALVDLRGNTAIVNFNDVKVYASQRQFSLRQPLVRHDEGIYIAREDVAPFFGQAFQTLIAEAGAEPARTPAGTELTPVETPLPGLLESVEVPEAEAPPAQPLESIAVPSARGSIERVILDPGHGGRDTGHVGQRDTAEKDLTLAIALQVAKILKDTTPLQVWLTREDDKELPVKTRTTFANAQRGDLLVSIHAGAGAAPHAHGFEIFYPQAGLLSGAASNGGVPDASRQYFRTAADRAELGQRYAQSVAAAVAKSSGMAPRGVHEAPLRAFRGAMMGGFLIEVGFVSNPSEEAQLAAKEYQAKLAEGIAEGIRSEWEDPGAARTEAP